MHSAHEESTNRRRLAGRVLHAGERPARPAASGSSGRPCARRTPARPAPSAWAASAAAWSTRRATSPRSARSRCRRWSPTCRARSSREFWQHVLARRSCRRFSPRELEACGRLTQPVLVRAGRQLLPADLLGRRPRPHRRQARATSARRNLLVLQRPQLERGRLPAATLRPAVRHEQRQQLQLLLPPGQRRRPGERHSAAARPRSRSKTSSTPTWCSSSAATRPAIIRG